VEGAPELSTPDGTESSIDSAAVAKDVADITELARDSDRISGGDDEGYLKDDGGGTNDVGAASAACAAASPFSTGSVAKGADIGGEGSVLTTGLGASLTGVANCSSESSRTLWDISVLSSSASWRL